MFWQWFFHRRSILETLKETAKFLPLKEARWHRWPQVTLVGNYFGFHLMLEGKRKGDDYRFLATIELLNPLNWRLFLCHEKRKTSFKPIADLKLVTTPHAKFNQTFLLLASDEEKAQAVFQPYLCGKMASLPILDWKLDVHAESAHFELLEKRLNASLLSEVLKVVFESLNALQVKDFSGGSDVPQVG